VIKLRTKQSGTKLFMFVPKTLPSSVKYSTQNGDYYRHEQ